MSDSELEPGPCCGVTKGVADGDVAVADSELEPGPCCGVAEDVAVAVASRTAGRLDPSVTVAAAMAIASVTERAASAVSNALRCS